MQTSDQIHRIKQLVQMIYSMTYMASIPEDYELNEADIESTIRFLNIQDPENANRETAIEFLEYMRLAAHKYAHDEPQKLELMYENLKNSRGGSA